MTLCTLLRCVVSPHVCFLRVVDWPPETFAEQFALFKDHGIMVSPHSAGLTNTMFMPQGSAVIEMFPYHMHHALYPGIAYQSGIKNIPIHAVNASIVFRRDPVSRKHLPSMGRCWVCWCPCIGQPRLPSFARKGPEFPVLPILWLVCVLPSHPPPHLTTTSPLRQLHTLLTLQPTSVWCRGLQPYFSDNCDNLVGFEMNTAPGDCRSHAVNYPFIIEPHDFEAALLAALEHIGQPKDRRARP